MSEHEEHVRSLQDEATEIGRSRGWDHANFVEAYNPYQGKPFELHIPTRYFSVESFFRSGWEEGVSNFEEGLNVDGTPRDEEANGCEGHYDDDSTLTSGVGIGEATSCDGSCK